MLSWLNSLSYYKAGISEEEIKKKYKISKVLKLNSNESPFLTFETLLNHIQLFQDYCRYPCQEQKLNSLIAKQNQISTDQVLVGNGSSEILDRLTYAFSKEPNALFLISEHSFPLYNYFAKMYQIPEQKVPIDSNYKLSLKNFSKYLEGKESPPFVVICNPNNPTGTYINESELIEFLEFTKNKNIFVILDEAYKGFERAKDFPNSVSLLNKYPHLLIVRTLSKVYGMAALRIGYLMGSSDFIAKFKALFYPFHVNALAEQAACFIFSGNVHFEKYIQKSIFELWSSLDYSYKQLEDLKFKYFKSQANFVFFKTQNEAKQLLESCLKKGLLIRGVPSCKEALRMTMGTQKDMQEAFAILKSLI